jgi:hypothetical protein
VRFALLGLLLFQVLSFLLALYSFLFLLIALVFLYCAHPGFLLQ